MMSISNNGDFMGYKADRGYVFLMVIDESSSMQDSEGDVIRGLRNYQKSFLTEFPDPEMVAVSVSKFSNWYDAEPFKCLKDMSFSYSANGCTALHYSICKGAEQLINYINRIREEMHIEPISTFIFFSDGEPCEDHDTESNAKKAISTLNSLGVTTVFVAFTKAIKSEFGKRLGFKATIDVDERGRLTEFLGEELSQSCREQSQSAVPLGENFFSSSGMSSSSASGTLTGDQQAALDQDFLNEI